MDVSGRCGGCNDMSDLASARGQLGDAKYITITDFNLFTDSGFFWVKWGDSALNAPPYGVNGFVIVSRPGTLENVCRQLVMRWGVAGRTSADFHARTYDNERNHGMERVVLAAYIKKPW